MKNTIIEIYIKKIDAMNQEINEVNEHKMLLTSLLTKVKSNGPRVKQCTLDAQGALIESTLGIKDPGVNKREATLLRLRSLDEERLFNLRSERRKTKKLLEITRAEVINEFVDIQYGIHELEIMNIIHNHEAAEPLVNKVTKGSLLDLY